MPQFDWERFRRDKDKRRAIAAARPLREKLEILDKLRVRTEQLKKLRPKPRPAAPRFAHVHLMEESPTAALEHAGGQVHSEGPLAPGPERGCADRAKASADEGARDI